MRTKEREALLNLGEASTDEVLLLSVALRAFTAVTRLETPQMRVRVAERLVAVLDAASRDASTTTAAPSPEVDSSGVVKSVG